jgi:hypothetical protein
MMDYRWWMVDRGWWMVEHLSLPRVVLAGGDCGVEGEVVTSRRELASSLEPLASSL